MVKGRQYTPGQNEVGTWFQHIGMPEKIESRSTGTTTGIMTTHNQENSNAHIKLASKFEERLKEKYNHENPFSEHDNRNTFQTDGVYFGHGLGKTKCLGPENQHKSEDIIGWGKKNGRSGSYSIYRDDFEAKTTEKVQHRRFTKHYPAPSPGPTKLDSGTRLWQTEEDKVSPPTLQTLANAQEPHLKANAWKYSYHSVPTVKNPPKPTSVVSVS